MAIDPNRWTLKTQEALRRRRRAAPAPRTTPRSPPTTCWPPCSASPTAWPLPLLAKAGVEPTALAEPGAPSAWPSLPKAYGGAEPQPVAPSRATLLETADTVRADMGDEYLSVEHLLLALADRIGVERDQLLGRPAPGARQPPGHVAEPRGAVPGPRALRPRPHRGGPPGQARPGHRARRGDPPRHPGAVAAAPRTTPCSSASPAWARPPSSRAWPTASSRATCPRACATSA